MDTPPSDETTPPPPPSETPARRLPALSANSVMFAIGGLIILLMIFSVFMQNAAHYKVAKKCQAGDIAVCTALIEAKSTPEKQLGAYYAVRGFHYAQKGEYEKAVADFNSAIGANEAGPAIYAHRGTVYIKMARYDEAIKDFNTAIGMASSVPDFYCGLIDAEYRKGDVAAGNTDLQRLKTMNASAACIGQLTPPAAPAPAQAPAPGPTP